jgi:uncharacterized protein YjlB
MEIEVIQINQNGWVPNNEIYPVRLYRAALPAGDDDLAASFERLFEQHDWPACWRNGIYSYHHYHSTAHEALGIARGDADVVLGGPGGSVISVAAGDALLLPAGTGHCLKRCADDFLVVGAYPRGQDFDLCRDAPTPDVRARLARLELPPRDPVTGQNSGLGPR